MKKLTALLILVLFAAFAKGQENRIRIPVVFHIIYSSPNQNLSRDSILAELQNLHDDFLNINADRDKVHEAFREVVGNPDIEFVLADTIVQPGGERGIIRIKSGRNRRNLHKRSDILDPKRFLNVYIGNIRGDGFVWSNPWNVPEDDAIHLSYKWIGSHYRVLTHETGHWFGLLHVFEGGCKGTGDGVADTPPQSASTDGDCDLCPPDVPDHNCGNHPSNYNNFMDYSGCRRMFTVGQVSKIRANISMHRPLLLESLSQQ
jgi:hypothetical protein